MRALLFLAVALTSLASEPVRDRSGRVIARVSQSGNKTVVRSPDGRVVHTIRKEGNHYVVRDRSGKVIQRTTTPP